MGRKVQRRHDDVHRMLLQPANRLIQIGDLQDVVARHVQAAPDQAARERRGFGDEDSLAARGPAGALKPILRGRVNHMVEIQEIRDSFAHHRRAEEAFAARLLSHRDRLFGDIQDLVDHQTHAAVAVVENDHLHRIGRLAVVRRPGFEYGPQRNQAEDAVAVLHHLASARVLDGRLRKLLEPGDQRKRNGQALEGAGPEQEQPLLLDPRLRLLFRRGARPLTGFGQHPGALADAQHVEDEGHAAIAHDGCAGVDGEPLQLLAQGLDHDFLGVVDAVHYQPELPVFRLQHHHADRLGPLGRFQPQHLIQVGDGQQTPAPAIHRRAVHTARCAFPRNLPPGGSVRAG